MLEVVKVLQVVEWVVSGIVVGVVVLRCLVQDLMKRIP
jgi:hypothetical protein